MLRSNCGWVAYAELTHGITTSGQRLPIASTMCPVAQFGVSPSAAAFTVFSVAGATTVTDCVGHGDTSPGRRCALRTGYPVNSWSAGIRSAIQSAAVGVSPRYTSHPAACASRIGLSMYCSGGAAQPTR